MDQAHQQSFHRQNHEIHLQAERGELKKVKKHILQNKLDVNIQSNCNLTPLHWAARKSQIDVVKFLLDNGANIEATTNLDTTPLLLCISSKSSKETIQLLIDRGANVQKIESNTKLTAFYHLVEGSIDMDFNYFKDIFYILQKNKANINAVNKYQQTPLDMVHDEHKNIIEFVRNEGGRRFNELTVLTKKY